MKYCNDIINPKRRKTIAVKVGNATIGGDAPILVQSMVNTSTRDVDATVQQIFDLAQAGCQLVRITVPTVKDATYLPDIIEKSKAAGVTIPISADIHFQPKAAFEALKWVDKVRINPGNFCDQGIMSSKEWSDEEFLKGEQKVKESFGEFVRAAKAKKVALRIGVNHGSLSARMVYRYGDTIEGMVESALEFLKVCEDEDFDQIVFSMKSSNPRVAIQAYRLLVARLDSDGHKAYPLHLGVTEAGGGVDARLKSAIGIGTLLQDGLGDTIRVSLTESPVAEIPVAHEIIKNCIPKGYDSSLKLENNPYTYERRVSNVIKVGNAEIGANNTLAVGCGSGCIADKNSIRKAEWSYADLRSISAIDIEDLNKNLGDRTIEVFVENIDQLHELSQKFDASLLTDKDVIWSYTGENPLSGYRALIALLQKHKIAGPILLRANTHENDDMLDIASWVGALLCDGYGDAIILMGTSTQADVDAAFDLLQAAGVRRTKSEYIACPSCGRTLFDLETVLSEVKSRTGHLKDIVIAVMGCIVNGPGEMADADFGYVGGAPGKISLYEGKSLVKKNIPQENALDELVELLKSRGKWVEPS